VLAVYAELLGASKLLAMDIDDWCIENTIENASVNQCESILALQGTVPPSDQAFDCILANINRHILLENMVAMAGSLRSGGLLLISGFYAEEDHLLIEAAEKQGMFFEKNSEKSGWSCLQFKKN
jgi:ribosomal protein L11 methyltransferase